MKAKDLSEKLIELMEKAKGFDDLRTAVKTSPTIPGLAKKSSAPKLTIVDNNLNN